MHQQQKLCGNPQFLLKVDTNLLASEIEIFMSLKLKTKLGSKKFKTGIALEVYEND